jgi:hypothetical protein
MPCVTDDLLLKRVEFREEQIKPRRIAPGHACEDPGPGMPTAATAVFGIQPFNEVIESTDVQTCVFSDGHDVPAQISPQSIDGMGPDIEGGPLS